MIPLRDLNPTRHTPWVTLVLIVACVGVWFGIQNDGDVLRGVLGDQTQAQAVDTFRETYELAAIPCEVVTGEPLTAAEIESGDCRRDDQGTAPVFPGKPVWLALLISMFLHGSFMHLAGNMLFLWIFGNNIEDKRGAVRYLGFYLIAGVVATLVYVALGPSSTIPLVGASGAIAGVMGAYLVLFPQARIQTVFLFIFILVREVPAWLLLSLWFISQFFIAPDAGVAWSAHVAGFVVGVAAGLLWRMRGPHPRSRRAASAPSPHHPFG